MLQNIKHKLVRSSRTKKKNGGFTLIEVIAVTVILGVLATMLIPSIDGAGAKARDAKLKNDLMTADQAVALYKLDKGTLPTNLKALFPVYLKNSDLKDAKNNDLVFMIIRTEPISFKARILPARKSSLTKSSQVRQTNPAKLPRRTGNRRLVIPDGRPFTQRH